MTQQTLMGAIDPEIQDALTVRADEIAAGATMSRGLAAALAMGSIPIALAALTKDVYGQTPSDVLEVLQFALLLEHLEAEFYTRGVASAGLIAAAEVPVFTRIRDHEVAHVAALQNLITTKGGTPSAKPAFDFTAKGNVAGFSFATGQYETFKALAQAFEDTGVRAYKGQVGFLINDKAALNAGLAIHSVEARHAAMVRRIRGVKGWITGSGRDGLPAFAQGIYDGEGNVTHATVNVATALPLTASNGGTNAATEAFDEPLTRAQVVAIVTPFLA